METDDEPRRWPTRRRSRTGATPAATTPRSLWDTCTAPRSASRTTAASTASCRTLSGGEQKRLALEALLRGPDEVLLLDEPDNYLDVPGKRWLEERLLETRKTVLFVCHDRELLAPGRRPGRDRRGRHARGCTAAASPATTRPATARHERLEELRRRWDEEHQRLIDLVRTLQQQAANSPDMASRYQAMQTRLAQVRGGRAAAGAAAGAEGRDAAARRAHRRPRGDVRAAGADRPDEAVRHRGLLRRAGRRARRQRRGQVALPAAARRRVVAHTGEWRLGARVVPGLLRPDPRPPRVAGPHAGRPALARRAGAGRRPGPGHGGAAPLRAWPTQGEQPFRTLSGGQQARFQILLLELSGSTLLLLDEPTDNLDVALRRGAGGGAGRRSTARSWRSPTTAGSPARFDRFLVFGADGRLYESAEPVFDETRVQRARYPPRQFRLSECQNVRRGA